ncbi:SDR family oxidoreductase [Methylophaga sp. SB9B]|uniref:SDR family oxidoreductase n=1 Tax=Methylophaga sp. SB9B TaxID=2570356 RepID=UPI0010A8AFCA|nr:SDR family oxidoreductase [Methylophaga sp. SB9B]THK41227.1 SDR family oxidoreductase [Methylophaga sp. SB9B]
MIGSVTSKQTIVVLTGATGGLGSALAVSLSKLGVVLILSGRDHQKLEQLNQQLGGQHHCIAGDLSTHNGRQALTAYCQQFSGGIDALINNAASNHFGPLQEMSETAITHMLTTNLLVPVELTRCLLPSLRKRDKAQIINIGSAFSRLGFPGFSVYSACKFGLRGFTEALRRELADTNITVRLFAPRTIKTAMNDANVMAMNDALGNHSDSVEQVAKQFVSFFQHPQRSEQFLGWPERFFGWLNSINSRWVDQGIAAKLPIIQRYWSGEKI